MSYNTKERFKIVETSTSTVSKDNEILDILEIPTCQHQWLIESPNGPTSNGECRTCGEERQFDNYIDGSSWGYDTSSEMGASHVPTKKEMQRGSSVDGDD